MNYTRHQFLTVSETMLNFMIGCYYLLIYLLIDSLIN